MMSHLGYKFNVLGVQSSCRLRGPKGQAVDYTITVLPSLPQLDCSLKRLDSEAAEEDEMLRLYHGESAEYECTFTNISNIKADCIRVSYSTFPLDMQDMVSLDQSIEDLELNPGESSSLKINVKAVALLVNNTFGFVDDDHHAGPSSITSSHLSRHDPGRWSGFSSTADSASGSVKRPSFVTVDIKISYSGGEGGRIGYMRELIRSLRVDICPSASVSKWDILPAEVQNENYLVLDISNQSIHEMELEYGPQKKTISMEPQDDCRIPVLISKFPQKSNENFRTRQQACSEYLQKAIHIQWSLPRLNNRKGFVSLRDIKLNEEMISSLELFPLEWKLTLDSKEPQLNSHMIKLGQEFLLQMTVTNRFDFAVSGHFSVEINLEEKSQSDLSFAFNTDQLVIQSQAESAACECQPGGLISHSSTVLPLSLGAYDVICKCSIVKVAASDVDNSGEEDVFHFVSKYPKINVHVTDDD